MDGFFSLLGQFLIVLCFFDVPFIFPVPSQNGNVHEFGLATICKFNVFS